MLLRFKGTCKIITLGNLKFGLFSICLNSPTHLGFDPFPNSGLLNSITKKRVTNEMLVGNWHDACSLRLLEYGNKLGY